MSPGYVSCFCAFCKSPRRVYSKRHIGAIDGAYTFLLGFLLGLLIWQEVNPKFIPISITFMGIAEIVIQLRWRLSLPCRKCGFDPLLYLRNPSAAAEKVRIQFEERGKNANILVKKLPVLENRPIKKISLLEKAKQQAKQQAQMSSAAKRTLPAGQE